MRTLNILHLGIGRVGSKVVEQITERHEQIRDEYLVQLNYCGLFTSRGGYFKSEGYTKSQLQKILAKLEKKKFKNEEVNEEIQNSLEIIPQPFLVLDTTAQDNIFPLLYSALVRGGYVVLSNKKPLTGRQEQFDLLTRLGKRQLFYETTVGAALPVIQTLKTLIETGDEIIEIKGCFSGTLGFIFSQLEDGSLFSETVIKAKEKGFTEPDPRDDLSGLDVARKALILARLLGRKLELSDIELTSLYPKKMDKLTIDEFLDSLSQLDKSYLRRMEVAQKRNRTLRFVATVTPKNCTVNLEEIDKTSDLGGLSGPDNLILFRTKRYYTNPLIIKGPGAGVEVTAAGLFGDILLVIKNLT